MLAYVRPPIPRQVFHDRAGEPFEYGERWAHLDGPPEDTYSVDSHPERFAPLVDVADALVRHLATRYAVTVEDVDLRGFDLSSHSPDSPAHPVLAGLRHVDPKAVRAVRLVPASDDAAPLTLVVTGYPSVVVRAGVLHEDPFPSCGCDACDDTAENAAEALEELVLGVVEGRFSEGISGSRHGFGESWVRYRLDGRDGRWGSGEGQLALQRAVAEAAGRRLAALPDGRWQPWARAT